MAACISASGRHRRTFAITARSHNSCKAIPVNHRSGRSLRKNKEMRVSIGTVEYVGHIIRPRHQEIATDATATINKLKSSTKFTLLRASLELCTVFRGFPSIFALVATQLNNKLKKYQPIRFGDLTAKEQHTTPERREELVSPSILTLPSAKRKYALGTNACNVQVRCVLLQEQPDRTTEPVGYWSWSQTKDRQA